MKNLLLLLIIVTLASCKEEHKIEIYLLKERVPNKHGISVWDVEELGKNLKSQPREETRQYELATYDTITEELIFADAFDAPPREKWQDKPFINDAEILLLDIKKGNVRISKTGADKISHLLKQELRTGHQYVITDNGNPVMTGYFWSVFSSYLSNADNIYYVPYNKHFSKPLKESHDDFEMYRTHYEPSKAEKTNFKNYPQLVNAFKESGRLKE